MQGKAIAGFLLTELAVDSQAHLLACLPAKPDCYALQVLPCCYNRLGVVVVLSYGKHW